MTRLLVVDDRQENLYMLQVLLSANGFEVELASNGAEALERARRAPPDLIISDILMPVMDGFALCRAWKKDERLKDIPFVFYTATYTGTKDEDFGLSLGAARFIVKPVEPDKLLILLQETIETHEAGKLAASREPMEEAGYYKEYNAALIRKLEDKVLQLEEANRALELDVAERKQAEVRLRKLNRVYAVLSEINQAIVRIREPRALFDQVCRIAIEIGGFRMAWIDLVDESSRQVQVVAHAGGTEVYMEQAGITLRGEPVAYCPVQNALCDGQRVVCNTIELVAPCQEIAFQLGVRSTAAFPLLVFGRIRGTVNFYSDESDFFDKEEIKLLDELAMDISFSMEFIEEGAARRRAEEKQRAEEERFHLAAESLSDVIYEWDIGDSMQWFGDIDELLGYAPGEFPRTLEAWVGILHPEDRTRVWSAVESHLRGEAAYDIEYRVRCKDGTWRHWLARGTVVRDAGGKPCRWIGAATDITARKRAENQLKRQAAIMDALLNSPQETVALLDREGQVLSMNLNGAEKFGMSPEAMIGKNIYQLIPEPVSSERRRIVIEVMRTGQPAHFEDQRQDMRFINSVYAVNDPQSGELLGAAIFAVDITERKQAEEALRQSQERERLLADLIEKAEQPVGIGYPDGRLGVCNRAFCELTGYSAEELQGIAWNTDLTPPEWLESEMEALAELDRLGKPVRYQKEYIRKDGRRVPIELFVHAVQNESGQVQLYYAFVTDITERKQAEDKNRAALEEKEALLREVHHRVKNNLQAMVSLLELQSAQVHDAGTVQFLKELEEQARTMSLVYERLYQSDSLAHVDMASYLQELAFNALQAFGGGHAIQMGLNVAPISLSMELAMPCGLIVNELVTNALKHAFPPGFRGQPAIHIALQLAGEAYRLTISDNGAGLPPGLDWRASRTLGLRLVNLWATHQLGGTLDVTSGPGTSYEVTFCR